MKNLENLQFKELSLDEMKEINGGFVCGGLCVAGIIIVGGGLGFAAGYFANN